MGKNYDYVIVGAGLFGAVFAREKIKQGAKVLVIDKREHIGGNVYTKDIGGIQVHLYGPHIFHTKKKEVWEYITQFDEFNRFTNAPIAIYEDECYNLPFNMNTFHTMWGIKRPEEARKIIDEQKKEITGEPKNLEEQAISMVGRDIYEKLIKKYTEKQWGRECKDLPKEIIKRLPVRFIYDNSYFSDNYQGIPRNGYTEIVKKMLECADVWLGIEYKKIRDKDFAEKIVYTGPIDEYYDYRFGELEYRSLRFEVRDLVGIENYQGNAVVNYTDDRPYTRIVEHKHFMGNDAVKNHTVISREYPVKWQKGDEPYYPINDEKNSRLFERYRELANEEKNVIFGGRMGEYKYFDMDAVIEKAIIAANE